MMAGIVAYCVVHVTAISQVLPHAEIVQFVAEIIPEGAHAHTVPFHVVPATQVAVAVV